MTNALERMQIKGEELIKSLSGLNLKTVSDFYRRFNREFVAAASLVLVGVLFKSFLYSGAVRTAGDLDSRISAIKAEMQGVTSQMGGAEGLAREASETEARLKGLEARLKTLSERLPSESKISLIISELAEGENPGVRIISVKPLPPEDKGQLIRLPFQVTIEGRYSHIGDYLESLERNRRLIVVDSFIMESKGGSIISAQVHLSAHVMRERN